MGDQSADAITILDHELKRIRSAIWSALDAEDWETLRGLTFAAEALTRAIQAIHQASNPSARSMAASPVTLEAPPAATEASPVVLEGTTLVTEAVPVAPEAASVVSEALPGVSDTASGGASASVAVSVPKEEDARSTPGNRTKDEGIPSPRKPKPAERKALQRHREVLVELLHQLPTGRDWTMPDWCHWRQAVCIARAGLEAAKEARSDRGYFMGELEQLSNRADEITLDSPFFAFNTEAYFAKETDWKELAQAFEWLAEAFEAKEWLDVTPDLDQKRRAEIVSLIGQTDRWLYETLHRMQFAVSDRPQTLIRDWWKGQSKTHREFETPKKDELSQLGKKWREERDKHELQQRKDAAMNALRRHIEHAEIIEEQESTWNDRLCELTDACLEAKVPPSSLELVPLLVDFLGVVQAGCKHRQAGKIAQFAIDQYRKKDPEFMEGLQRSFTSVDERLLEGMKPVLAGKRLLFVGGNKGQEPRRQAIERLFACELEWPDMEDDTNLNVLRPKLAHADLVCLLIRFSRHGYKEIIDEAKEIGKQVVVFRAGLHPNRLLHDLKEQLPAGRV
ncbi:MAG: hypothetical protein HONBIEJF_01641 [Fimbriimonadaceae bacterium]|nr:hypothetical protein [Fimbriimonadaceae bacterium]